MRKFISVMLSFAVCLNFTFFAPTVEAIKPAVRSENCYNASKAINVLKNIDNVKAEDIELSRPNGDDFDVLKKYYKDVDIRYYLEATDRQMTEQQALSELNRYNTGSDFTFVIKNKNGDAVGAVILSVLRNYVNVAYWVIPKFRGNNYAAKACLALIKEVHKKDFGVVFFVKMNAENKPSKNVIRKLKAALVDTDENQKAQSLNELHYEIKEKKPIRLNYKISPVGDDNFLFYIFEGGKQTYSGVCSRKQILDFTYKRIFDSNELELVRLEHFIRLVH